jgi:hypothetical protein
MKVFRMASTVIAAILRTVRAIRLPLSSPAARFEAPATTVPWTYQQAQAGDNCISSLAHSYSYLRYAMLDGKLNVGLKDADDDGQ